MLILVLIETEQDQVYMFQYICFKSFQINLLVITYHFEHTNHDNHLDFLTKNFSKNFLHVYNLHQ